MSASISVTLTSGPTRLENVSVEDCSTVNDLADEYGDMLGIPSNAVILVNGRSAAASARVQNGDEVAWNKPTGSKG